MALSDRQLLDDLQARAIRYFVDRANADTGLVSDSSDERSHASIAGVGMGLALYAVGAERGVLQRERAAELCLRVLRLLATSPSGPKPGVTRHKGFFYHFLKMDTARRAGYCELSTMDTALLLAGALTAGQYFDRDNAAEHELRTLADALYRDADWHWAQNGGAGICHGWRPRRGFMRYRWIGYSEALLLYVLALGSPTRPADPESYRAWCGGYKWQKAYGIEMFRPGPLFIHEYPQLFLDLRGVADAPMRDRGIDYFINTQRAVQMQQEYAIRNPREFPGYGEQCWGLSATRGPGKCVRTVAGRRQRFYGYAARGAPYGPDDGTITPSVVIAAVAHAPEIALPTIRRMHDSDLGLLGPFGLWESFNRFYPHPGRPAWLSPVEYAISRGPAGLMIENHRSGLIWKLMRKCPHVRRGLIRAGFTGGWLDD